MKNIGLIGKIGAGKSSAADILNITHGYRVVSFAAPLKDLVIQADPIVSYRTKMDGCCPVHLSDILDSGVWFEDAKREYPEVRRCLQRIGQGIRRIEPDYWLNLLMRRVIDIPATVPIVIPDVRYANEALRLRRADFTLVRIERPRPDGYTMEETRALLHSSETSLDGFDADVTIKNDGTRDDFVEAVLNLV